LIIENVAKKLDSETKEQVMPLLEAILQAQPTVNIKTYQQTQITITMPKSRYNNMGRPQVGNIIEVDLKKI
jgi:phage-related protein